MYSVNVNSFFPFISYAFNAYIICISVMSYAFKNSTQNLLITCVLRHFDRYCDSEMMKKRVLLLPK